MTNAMGIMAIIIGTILVVLSGITKLDFNFLGGILFGIGMCNLNKKEKQT